MNPATPAPEENPGPLTRTLMEMIHGELPAQYRPPAAEAAPQPATIGSPEWSPWDDAWVEAQLQRLAAIIRDESGGYSHEESVTAIQLHQMLLGRWPLAPFKGKAALHLYTEYFLKALGPEGDKTTLEAFFKKNPCPAWMIPLD